MSQRETRTVSFGITGEFITRIAREWFYLEGKEFEKIMQILMDSMTGTDTPEATIRRYAEDILLGRAALKGNTTDGTYHLETYKPDEQPEMYGSMNIWKVFGRNLQEKKRLQKELEKMAERYAVAMEYVPSYMQREVRKKLGEETTEDRQRTALDSFIKRMTDEEKHTTEDYGWLEPNGTFHAVEWAQHQAWAIDYMKKSMSMEDWLNGTTDAAGDYLTERGWVLLHNPSQGIAIPTKDPLRSYTKAQKEFLYDYYIERGCSKEANEIWEEDDL